MIKRKPKPDLETAVKRLISVNKGLIKAQMINTEKLNTLLAMAEDEQRARHLDQEDTFMGMSKLELVDDDEQGKDWDWNGR